MQTTKNIMEPGRYCYRQFRVNRSDAFSNRGLACIRRDLLPRFMDDARIQDVTKNGLRMVMDVPCLTGEAEVTLESGPDVPAPNIQSWRAPKNYSWDPAIVNPMFKEALESFSANLGTLPTRGNKLYYSGASRKLLFGVFNSDPQASFHVLVMPRDNYVHILDDGLTDELFVDAFRFAFMTVRNFGASNGPIRIFANAGAGYQGVPRLHIHAQGFNFRMNSLLPEDHGFIVGQGGIVDAPEGPSGINHKQMIDLVTKRDEIKGFTPEAKAKRAEIDRDIYNLFNMME